MFANKSNCRLWVAYLMDLACCTETHRSPWNYLQLYKCAEQFLKRWTRKLPRDFKSLWPLHGAGKKSVLLSHLKRQILQEKQQQRQKNYSCLHVLSHETDSWHYTDWSWQHCPMLVYQFCPEVKLDMKDTVPLPFLRSSLVFIPWPQSLFLL